jgi:hypothetical protein
VHTADPISTTTPAGTNVRSDRDGSKYIALSPQRLLHQNVETGSFRHPGISGPDPWNDIRPDSPPQLLRQLIVCLFCIDIGRWVTINASMNQAKFDALEQYNTNPLFTDAERAALDYVTELTKDKKVNPDTFARLSRHYSERAICEIVWLVASEHLYNMTNIGLNIHSDMLCSRFISNSAPRDGQPDA